MNFSRTFWGDTLRHKPSCTRARSLYPRPSVGSGVQLTWAVLTANASRLQPLPVSPGMKVQRQHEAARLDLAHVQDLFVRRSRSGASPVGRISSAPGARFRISAGGGIKLTIPAGAPAGRPVGAALSGIEAAPCDLSIPCFPARLDWG